MAATARRGLDQKFEDEVLAAADGEDLAPDEFARRVAAQRRAYFARLALRSAQSRRKAAEARRRAEQLDQDAAAAEGELQVWSDDGRGDAA